MNLFIFVFINIFVFVSSYSVSLCDNVTSTWANLPNAPSIVVLREKNSTDARMESAMSDVDCWLQKNFNVTHSYTLPTRGDDELVCYKIATAPIDPGQLMVVVTEGASAEYCATSLYGPIPNIMNIKIFVDGTTKQSATRMEISLKNTGGHVAVQFELHRPSVISKIQKTMVFMLQLSSKTLDYAKLMPFWKPKVEVPDESYQHRAMAEEWKLLTKNHTPISWLLILSVMPMFIFGSIVSCYIVIHPRGGLTYTDEEVDFTIQEVDSNSKVNIVQDKSVHHLPFAPSVELEVHTAKSPDLHTATESDEVHTDVTVLSERKSTETVKLAIVDKGSSEPSLKTGRE